MPPEYFFLHHSLCMCYDSCVTEFSDDENKALNFTVIPSDWIFYLDKNLTWHFLIFLFITVISLKLQRKGEKMPPYNLPH